MSYTGKNYVATNTSSRTHGRPAALSVSYGPSTVVLAQGLKGGNQ